MYICIYMYILNLSERDLEIRKNDQYKFKRDLQIQKRYFLYIHTQFQLKRPRSTQKRAEFRLAGKQRGSAIWRNPSKIKMGPQQLVAGGGTSKSGGGTGKAIHAVLSSSRTRILQPLVQLLVSSSCPRHPHPQLSHCSYFSIP